MEVAMTPRQDRIPIVLPARAMHRIEDGEGLTVTCARGVAWITQADDRRDIILASGQSFTLDKQGLAVVFALKEAVVTVSSRQRTASPQLERAYAA
jgi:hypothetical protein